MATNFVWHIKLKSQLCSTWFIMKISTSKERKRHTHKHTTTFQNHDLDPIVFWWVCITYLQWNHIIVIRTINEKRTKWYQNFFKLYAVYSETNILVFCYWIKEIQPYNNIIIFTINTCMKIGRTKRFYIMPIW